MTTLADLALGDIGRRVRITTTEARLEGCLRDLRVDTEWILVGTVGGARERIPGRQSVAVRIGDWSCDNLPLDCAVTRL